MPRWGLQFFGGDDVVAIIISQLGKSRTFIGLRRHNRCREQSDQDPIATPIGVD